MRRKSAALRVWFILCVSPAFLQNVAFAASLESPSTETAEVEPGNAATPMLTSACCGKLCPCTYGWAEALILGRENQADDQALVLNLNTDAELLSVDDLDFDWTGGLRLGYGHRACDCWAWEFGYLGVFDQTADDDVSLANSLTLPPPLGDVVNNFFGASEVDVEYSSDIHSFEANLVRCCCCEGCCYTESWEWLAGFRYLRLDEEFSITAFDPAESSSTYEVETENNLYGGQVGARYRRCRGRWSWESTGKAGIYGNDMEQSQDPILDFPNNFVFRPGRSSTDSDVAFVGDLNFSAIYHLSRVWGLRAGYNLIWIDGVALAPNQLDFSNTPTSGTELDDGGTAFLHGVNIGLEARW